MLKNTNENPVYYVQYAYARIANLFRVIESNNQQFKEVTSFNKLNYETANKLIKILLQYPSYVEESCH